MFPTPVLVGSLPYVMLVYDDLTFALWLMWQIVTKATQNLLTDKPPKGAMHYLHVTTDLVLCYQGKDLRLRVYLGADWGVDPNKSRSTSKYVFTLSGEPYHNAVRNKIGHHCQLWKHSLLLVTIETKGIAIRYI